MIFKSSNSALGVFFRIPESGKVKKRLASEIGNAAALKAYESMLCATIDKISCLKGIDVYGFYDGDAAKLKDYGFEIELIQQTGRGLGQRMLNAFAVLAEKGYEQAALIGSDSPDLPAHFITDAFKRLNCHDIVLGPSEDGGCYLIGIKAPCSGIFNDILWGSAEVLSKTIRNAENKGMSYFLLPQWYDIDDKKSMMKWQRGCGKDINT
jgi:rSAM/selenodomain-associated transferase 1